MNARTQAMPEAVPDAAFQARPVADEPALLAAYFAQVDSYEADRLAAARRWARTGFVVGAIGALVGVLGAGTAAAIAAFKAEAPVVVFRVDNATGAVDRVHDVRGGEMAVTEASQRYFLWQYVRLRQGWNAPEAQASFDAVAWLSSPAVQKEYAAAFRGSNPTSPQVTLGRDGHATLRWISTAFLGPRLAQVRFVQHEAKGDVALPAKRMVATIGFDFAPAQLTGAALNVNPLGFVVTSYRADVESTP